MTAAPSRCWNHPLSFAIWRSICTHISVVPSATMCRSNKVANSDWSFYEYICYSPSHRHRHDGLAAPSTAVHISLSPHLILRPSLIHRRWGAEAIWGWDIAYCFVYTCFAWDDLIVPRQVSNPPMLLGSTHHNSHNNLSTPSIIRALKPYHPWGDTVFSR